MNRIRATPACVLAIVCAAASRTTCADDEPLRLRIAWADNMLSIEAPTGQPPIPGGKLLVHYLEAYCRPGSTDRDWGQTVIGPGNHTRNCSRAWRHACTPIFAWAD